MAEKIPVSVVIVTYNSAEVIMKALNSVDSRAEIIVVDNASTDGTVECVRDAGFHLITNRQNTGFGPACNQGAALTSRPFILFLNPDTQMRTDTIDHLIAAAAKRPEYAAFNPRILFQDGTQFFRRQSCIMPTVARKVRPTRPTKDQDLYMLSGAALFCRRSDFEAIGGFDENIFMYAEDDDLTVRLLQRGKRLGHVHDAIVEHVGGGSTAYSRRLQTFKSYHRMRSHRYVTAKHGVIFRRRYQIAFCSWRLFAGWILFNKNERIKYYGYLQALVESNPITFSDDQAPAGHPPIH